MKVFVVHFRNLIWGAAAFCLVLAVGLFLLLNDPLNVSSPYQQPHDSVQTASSPFMNTVKPTLALDIKVNGSTADVKMITESFEFTKDGMNDVDQATPEHGKGHAHLYLDGQYFGKLYESEFLLKKLPAGNHEIRVALNYSNHVPYNVEAVQTITVK